MRRLRSRRVSCTPDLGQSALDGLSAAVAAHERTGLLERNSVERDIRRIVQMSAIKLLVSCECARSRLVIRHLPASLHPDWTLRYCRLDSAE
jgi:hypothetical protein